MNENGGYSRLYTRNNSNDSAASNTPMNGTRTNMRNFINQNKKEVGSNQNKRELGPVREGRVYSRTLDLDLRCFYPCEIIHILVAACRKDQR